MTTYLGYEEQELVTHKGINTAKEIQQQPSMWQKSLEIYNQKQQHIDEFISGFKNQADTQIIFCGAGSSAFIGKAIADYINSQSKYNCRAIDSTTLLDSPECYFNKKTLLVSFARSGNSPESLACIEIAEHLLQEQVKHLIITCNPESKITSLELQNRQYLIKLPEETHDLGFAMTSSFSSMYLMASLILDNDKHKNKHVQNTISMFVDNISTYCNYADNLINLSFERMVYLCSGFQEGIGLEASLKFLELTQGTIPSFSNSPLGFRHGPKSIVNPKTLIIIFIPENKYKQKYSTDIINELTQDNQAKIAVVRPLSYERVPTDFDCFIKNYTPVPDLYLGLLHITFAQIFALKKSLHLNITPDNPCPSGEVNRVVQGVTIHAF